MQKILIFIIAPLAPLLAFAADTGYEMRVDGLACPYCAYGIEKKFKAIEGVKTIDVDLEKGLVSVCASDTTSFTDEQLIRLFTDAGFTYRSMEKREQCDPA